MFPKGSQVLRCQSKQMLDPTLQLKQVQTPQTSFFKHGTSKRNIWIAWLPPLPHPTLSSPVLSPSSSLRFTFLSSPRCSSPAPTPDRRFHLWFLGALSPLSCTHISSSHLLKGLTTSSITHTHTYRSIFEFSYLTLLRPVMLRWDVRSMFGWGGLGIARVCVHVCVNYSSPLEMQTTAEAREPPRYVGHFLSVLQEREKEGLKRSCWVMNRQSETHKITSDRRYRWRRTPLRFFIYFRDANIAVNKKNTVLLT